MYKMGRCLLDQRLKETGMTRSELVEKSGISRQNISDYATNRRYMSLTTAKNIASILWCRIEELYEWHLVKRRDE